MSEIVYTYTEEKREKVPSIGQDGYENRDALDSKVTVFKDKNKVAVVYSRLLCGVPNAKPENKDKRWYRWHSVASCGLRRNKQGTIIPWNCTRDWNSRVADQWRHTTPGTAFNLLEDDGELAEAYRKACWESYGDVRLEDVFPIAGLYNLPAYSLMPRDLRPAMRLKTMDDFVAGSFGKKRATGRMVNAVAGTDPWMVAYAYQFRGYVDDGKLITFLENNRLDDEMQDVEPFHPTLRLVVKEMDQSMRDSLIDCVLDYSDMKSLRFYCRQGKSNMLYLLRKMRDTSPTNWQQVASAPLTW
jgi:hypothetical protein